MAAGGDVGHEVGGYRCHDGPVPALDPLPAVRVRAFEVVTVTLPLRTPLTTAAGRHDHRDVLLVHVEADEAEGWAECAVEPDPTYSPEFAAAAALVLLDHLLPRASRGRGPQATPSALGDALRVCGVTMPRGAAVELAVLDAQLRAAGRSLAGWLGATADRGARRCGARPARRRRRPARRGRRRAARGRRRGCGSRSRPVGPPDPLLALRAHVGDGVAAAGRRQRLVRRRRPRAPAPSTTSAWPASSSPSTPTDLLGHARLAEALATPICLDEPLTSLGAVEAAVALGACEVVCLKPARVGGWRQARAVHDRCVELGVPVWVGGMLETGVGRAANLAVAALPGMALPPDLDPRGRYDPDLAEPAAPGRRRGGGARRARAPARSPDAALLAAAEVVRVLVPMTAVTLDDVRAAAERIAGSVERTPSSRSDTLSDILGCGVVLKLENLQFTAAFKERGALNKLLSLSEDERRCGVVAMSAGNHAQAVARHADPPGHRRHDRHAGPHAVREGPAHRGARRRGPSPRRRTWPRPPRRPTAWRRRAAPSCTPTTTRR